MVALRFLRRVDRTAFRSYLGGRSENCRAPGWKMSAEIVAPCSLRVLAMDDSRLCCAGQTSEFDPTLRVRCSNERGSEFRVWMVEEERCETKSERDALVVNPDGVGRVSGQTRVRLMQRTKVVHDEYT
jgi:hypothetical protein